MWTKEEPTDVGYYWAIRRSEFSYPSMEIVYVFEGKIAPVVGKLFAWTMGYDFGVQLFEVEWWWKINYPAAPVGVDSYSTAPMHSSLPAGK